MDVEAKIKMETCQDLKKLFAPWRILEVMDLSQQSLNQVKFIVVLLYSIIQFYVFKSFVFIFKECCKSIYNIQKFLGKRFAGNKVDKTSTEAVKLSP